jgi:hypothetical protein
MFSVCSTNGAEGNACWVLVGKPEGKRLLGRPRRRWEHNIKMERLRHNLRYYSGHKYYISGHYPSSCFYLKHNVLETGFSLRLQVDLLSWTQSVELGHISEHLHQHRIGYKNQAQHKLSARVNTNITKTLKILRI